MAIPNRLAAEYPSRCLQLISAVEGFARDHRLVGSFSLLAAAAVLTIPFECAQARHFLHRERDDQMTAAIDQLSKVKFIQAPFWQGEGPGDWRQSHIIENANSVEHWVGRDGKHPLATDAKDFLPGRSAAEVLRATGMRSPMGTSSISTRKAKSVRVTSFITSLFFHAMRKAQKLKPRPKPTE